MANLTGTATIGTADLYSSSTQPNYNYELGQEVKGKYGKAFRYALFGELGVVGDIMQSSVVDTQFDSMTLYAAGAIGDTQLKIVSGTTSVTAGQFVGGTATVSVTPGLGQEFTIIGHDTSTSGTTLTLQLDRPIRVALTVAASKVTMRRSPYSGILKCPTTLTGTPVGVCIYPVASGEYGWVQTKGVVGILSDNSTGAVGSDVGVPGATAGTVGVNVAGTGKCNTVGHAMRALSSGVVIPVNLNLP
jgi:hypothetical protein